MSADFTTARLNMVESQVRTQDVTDTAIHDAMRAVRREDLLPPGKAFAAYADAEVEYAPGRYLLKPRDVAKLLQELRPQPFERALAIAAPYAAAVLEHIGLSVERFDGEDLTRLPGAWIEALGPNGRLAVIEREGPVGKAAIYLRTGETAGRREVFDATPPVLPGFARERRFAF